jgi:predicted transcriptional regulator
MTDRESALKHRTRKMIYNYIQEHPGTSFATLRSMFDLTDGTLRYHLGYLEKTGKVNTRHKLGKRVFFPTDISGPGYDHPAVERDRLNRAQKRIVEVVKGDPGITERELYDASNLTKKALGEQLKILRNMGLIVKDPEDGGYEYVSRSALKQEVFKLLVIKLIRHEIDEETFHMLKDELEMSED